MTSQAGDQEAAGGGRGGEGDSREPEGREEAAAKPPATDDSHSHRLQGRMKNERSQMSQDRAGWSRASGGQILGKSFLPSEPQFPSLGNGNGSTTSQAQRGEINKAAATDWWLSLHLSSGIYKAPTMCHTLWTVRCKEQDREALRAECLEEVETSPTLSVEAIMGGRGPAGRGRALWG